MRDATGLTPALEDYLEAIYVLQKEKEIVKVVDIAEHLNVTMASVTGGVRRLAAMEYVVYEKWRQVRLTPEGERIAEKVSRRHHELLTFYHEVLGAEKELARESACRVEHVLAPSIIERIMLLTRWMKSLPEDVSADFRKKMRGQLEDPGKKAPLTLDMVKSGEKVTVVKIAVKGDIGRRLMDMGITKGSEIQVVRVAPLGDPVDIKLKGYHLSLRKSEAAGIVVERS